MRRPLDFVSILGILEIRRNNTKPCKFMLSIKLRRVGKKHQASFRIVAAEGRSKMQGRYVEDLGWFNPHSDELNIKKERVQYRLQTGARPTPSVHNLLVRAGIIAGPKMPVHRKKKGAAAEPSSAPTQVPTAGNS